jgi:hypothetical protein
VLEHPADQIVGDTDVESAAAPACKNVNPKPHLLLNDPGFARVGGLDTGMDPQSIRFIKTLSFEEDGLPGQARQ